MAQDPPAEDPAPLSTAPELVVEIISPSDTSTVLAEKIADYQRVNVREAWIAQHSPQTVEIVLLTPTSAQSVAMYGVGDVVQSVVFPGLSCAVNDIFAEF